MSTADRSSRRASCRCVDGDDETTLAARVLAVEHRLLPAAVGWYCAGRLVIDAGRVRVDVPMGRADDALTVPQVGAPAR